MSAALFLCLSLLSADSEPAQASSEPSSDEAYAVEDESIFSILAEEEQVITGARAPIKVREAGSSVWVIDRATIDSVAATSLVDLLRLLPGVFVREVSAGYAEASLRFPLLVPDNQVLFLLDGRSIAFDVFGYSDKNAVELQDIERIEVIMGPASTLYGTNAYAGVVNIVTRRASVTSGSRTHFQLKGGAGYGSNGQLGAPPTNGRPMGAVAADFGWGNGKVGLRVSAGADYFPSFTDVPHADETFSPFPARRVSGMFDVVEEVNGWTLRQRATASFHETPLPVFSLAPAGYADYSLTLNAVRPNLAKEGDELSLMLWGRYFTIDYLNQNANTAPVSMSASVGSGELFAQYRTPKFFNNQIIVGTQIRLYNVGQYGVPKDAELQQFYGLFAEDTWRPIEKLIFTLGARVETNENKLLRPFQRFNVAARFSAVYLPSENHSLRLEVASSFRNPTPIESFIDLVSPDGVPELRGRVNLKTEHMQQVSLGYNGRIKWFRPRVDIWAARLLNIIYPATGGDEDTAIDGVPVQLYAGQDRKLPLVFTNLTETPIVPGASTRLEGDWGFLKAFVMYQFSPISPMHLAGAGITFTHERVTASTQLYYVDSITPAGASPLSTILSAHLVWNASVLLHPDADKRWSVGVSGTNLLDSRFFVGTRPQNTANRDYAIAERIGQRIWLTMRYALD